MSSFPFPQFRYNLFTGNCEHAASGLVGAGRTAVEGDRADEVGQTMGRCEQGETRGVPALYCARVCVHVSVCTCLCGGVPRVLTLHLSVSRIHLLSPPPIQAPWSNSPFGTPFASYYR